jgi:hypothetical protein
VVFVYVSDYEDIRVAARRVATYKVYDIQQNLHSSRYDSKHGIYYVNISKPQLGIELDRPECNQMVQSDFSGRPSVQIDGIKK